MSVIEHWTMSECPDCGVLTCATAEQVQWCDEHCRSDKTVVEVVRADTYRGAVEESTKAHAALGIALSLMTPEQRELWDAALVKLSDRDLGGQ